MPSFQFPRLLLNLPSDFPTDLCNYSCRLVYCMQFGETGIFAVSVHRRGMLSEIGGSPHQVIGREGIPAILLRIIDPAQILGMVIAVVGKHVEAHTVEHLLRIRCVAARDNPGQLHQRVIVERGRAPIHLKDSAFDKN